MWCQPVDCRGSQSALERNPPLPRRRLNPETAFVAALGHSFGDNEERGVFRTRDGGKTWEKVLSTIYCSTTMLPVTWTSLWLLLPIRLPSMRMVGTMTSIPFTLLNEMMLELAGSSPPMVLGPLVI